MRAVIVVVLTIAASTQAQAQWAATAYVDNNVAGDVQGGRLGLGVSGGYYIRGRIGLELDAELHGHFFRDEDVAALMPDGVDLDTRAALASGNVVVPYCIRGTAGIWCPYATAGLGVIRSTFEGTAHEPGAESFVRTQTNLALDAGIGVTHALTRWVGFRVERATSERSSTRALRAAATSRTMVIAASPWVSRSEDLRAASPPLSTGSLPIVATYTVPACPTGYTEVTVDAEGPAAGIDVCLDDVSWRKTR